MRDTISTLTINKEPLSAAEQLLIKQAIEGLNKRYQDVPEDTVSQAQLIERAEYELNVIISMGFADYLLIVSDFLKIGAALGHVPDNRLEYLHQHMAEMSMDEMLQYIYEDQSAPGLAVGLGRGSGAGSVICYALEITHLDPMVHGLLFERFLNPERVSMPDVDSDFANAEKLCGTRDIVIEYVSKRYGKNAICGINTKSTLAAKGAIDAVQRALCGRDTKDLSREQALDIQKKYRDLAVEMKKLIPDLPGTTFDSEVSDNMTVEALIRQTYSNNPIALEFLDYAIQLEGVNDNYGKHAAGVVIADNGDIGAYGALMYDEKIGWKIQMDGPDVEGIGGLLKMDFLGLTTLNIITHALRLIQQNHGIYIDPFNVPQEPEIYQKIFSEGNTFGIFQFNKPGMQKMLKRFHPDNLDELILLNAVNRPGPMQYFDFMVKKKFGQAVPESAFDKVPCIQDILRPTYGYPVYQEQVMQIPQAMAGYSLGQADEIRRAMSKKKLAVIEENRELFVHGGIMENHDTHKKSSIQGSIQRGIPENDAYAVYDGIQDFAKYGFNKSHAAVYAVTAYMTAWLKFHYPVEFYTAYLNIADDPLEDILADAKANHVKITAPDINRSEGIFTCDSEQIFYGYSGMGLQAAMTDTARDYVSMADFIIRTSLTESTITKLIGAGAFDRFSSSRTALLKVLPIYMDFKKTLKNNAIKLEQSQQLLTDLKNGIKITKEHFKDYGLNRKTLPKVSELEQKVAESSAAIAEAKAMIEAQVIPVRQYPDDPLKRLQEEKELLKAYITGHPLEMYGAPQQYGCTPITDLHLDEDKKQNNCTIMGMVTGWRVTSKKDNANQKMAFFTLEDVTGQIPVCAFTGAYALYADIPSKPDEFVSEDNQKVLKPGAILKLKGYLKQDSRSDNDTLQFVISDKVPEAVTAIKPMLRPFQFNITGVEEINILIEKLKAYRQTDGHIVYIHNQTTGDIEQLDFKVSDAAGATN